MSNSGQSNYKGINTQAKASLFLFLSEIRNADFDSVTLEDEKWEDFTFHYRSGRKVIYESKDREGTLSWAGVKKILTNINNRQSLINEGDEIVIVCNNVTPELESGLKYLGYGFPEISERYKAHGFTDELIELLRITRFYHIPRDDTDKDTFYMLALKYFYSYLPLWIPESEAERFLDNILVHEIYEKSQSGDTFAKVNLNERIEEFKKEKIKYDGTYDTERRGMEKPLKEILNAVDNPSDRFQLEGSQLSSLSAQPQLMYFLIERLMNADKINLQEWNDLWKALLSRQYSFNLIRIFEKKADIKKNAAYVIKFSSENFEAFSDPYGDNHNQAYVVDLVKKTLTNFPDLSDSGMNFVDSVLSVRNKEYKTLESKREYSYEKELVGKLFEVIFDLISKDKDKIEKLISMIVSNFDLVSDDGTHSMFTPAEIFTVIKKYISLDFENNFPKIVAFIVYQYPSARVSLRNFDGWDHIGGMSSNFGGLISITDRHFVAHVLIPALQEYYDANNDKAWDYVVDKCVSADEKSVSSDSPDFLNRSVLKILLDQYSNTKKHSRKAVNILKKFIAMNRGIPDKSSLIFQEVHNDTNMDDKYKWSLVSYALSLSKGLPSNEFIEQITSELAAGGHKDAVTTIAKWVKEPGYYKYKTLGSIDPIKHVDNLISDGKGFSSGVTILRSYLASKQFKDKDDDFSSYDISRTIANILKKDFPSGLALLNLLYSDKKFSTNQQQVLTGALRHADDDPRLTLKLYKQFLRPIILEELGTIGKIEDRFTNKYARESIVQFAEKLVRAEFYIEGLELIKLFVSDSDPSKDGSNDKDDKDGKFNYHQQIIDGENPSTISTVRAWCANVLRLYAFLSARDYLEDAFKLLIILVKDKNLYVRMHALSSLEAFAKNRHTVLPDNSEERFIPIKLADYIEEVTFSTFNDSNNRKVPLMMRHIAIVMSNFRNMNTKTAFKYLDGYRKMDDVEALEPLTGLYIYYAEHRKDTFKDTRYIPIFGSRLKTLQMFNSKPFEDLVIKILESGPEQIVAHFSWLFWTMTKDAGNKYEENFKISMKYFPHMVGTYSHKVYGNVYYFIDENMNKKFDECYELWEACIKAESKYFKDDYEPAKLYENHWWPFNHNGKMLLAIAKNKGNKEFLKWLEVLLDYPDGVLIATDLNDVVDYLKTFTSDKDLVGKLFKKLLNKNTNYLYAKEEWEKNSK